MEHQILASTDSATAAMEIDVDNATGIIDILHETALEPKHQVKRNPAMHFNADISKMYSNLPETPAIPRANGYMSHFQNQYNSNPASQPIHYSIPAPFDCGRCSREINLCQVVSGIFTRSSLPYGYSLVSPIPAGTCNITIFEAKRSKNYFALRNKDEKYVLNGDWKIQAAGEYFIGGTTFKYSPSDGSDGEKLSASGPLKEPLDLMLLYQSSNPGIKYEYRIPIRDRSRNQPRIIPAQPILPSALNRAQPIRMNNMFLSDSSNIAAGNAFLHAPAQSATVEKFFRDPQPSGIKSHHGIPTAGRQDVPIKHKINKSFIANINKPNGWRNNYRNQDSNSITKSSGANGRGNFHHSNKVLPLTTNFPKYSPSGKDIPEFQSLDGNKLFVNPETTYYRNISIYHTNDDKSPDYSYTVVNLKNHQKIRHKHGSKKLNPGPPYDDKSYSASRPNKNAIDQETAIDSGLDEHSKRNRKHRKRKKIKKRRGRFHWVFKGLTDCSRACGGGEQTSILGCERRKKNRAVSAKRCYGLQRPEINIISCNLKPCPAKWVPEEWGRCSVSCGMGVQTRMFVCEQVVTSTLTMMVSEGACLDEITAESTKVCDAGRCPSKTPHWEPQAWSQCSTTCGAGRRRRNIDCIVLLQKQNDSICEAANLSKPPVIEECDMGECVHHVWLFTDWYQNCSNGCDEAMQRNRNVVCYGNHLSDPNMCDISMKPQTTEPCVRKEECQGEWFVGPWSQCNVPCGVGNKNRAITCLMKVKGKWENAEEVNCPFKSKPTPFQECHEAPCPPRWYTSEWSQCSCDGKQRSRSVKCLENELLPSRICDNSSKPQEYADCHIALLCRNFSLGVDKLAKLDSSATANHEKTLHEKDQDIVNYEDYLHDPLFSLNLNSDVSSEAESGILPYAKTFTTANAEQNVTKLNKLYPTAADSEHRLNSIPRKDQPLTVTESSYATSIPRLQKDGTNSKAECLDRIKNCGLVFRARLCKLKYYSQLCCHTCQG